MHCKKNASFRIPISIEKGEDFSESEAAIDSHAPGTGPLSTGQTRHKRLRRLTCGKPWGKQTTVW
jgi:hypothetical protein